METFLGLDYPTWWFLVVGGLFSGYAILDGFDFGAGAWHMFFRQNKSREIALKAIDPTWHGNEVWLVIGGGTLFAGFPVFYGTLLSAMYTPFILFLLFIIFRGISIKFRNMEEMPWWRKMWDWSYSISSIMLAVLLGVVVGNVLNGMPLDENYEYIGGGFFEFLNPFSILVGITSLALFMMHGGIYLLLKTEGKLYDRLQDLLKKGIIFFIVSYLITTVYTLLYVTHLSEVFRENQALFVVPLLVFLSIANVPRLVSKKKYGWAFIFTSLTIALLFVLVAFELFPRLLLSSGIEANSITIYNAAASTKTLKIMMGFVAVGGPLVLLYSFFVYRTFWGKVKVDAESY
ncbi:cytochrome D oxidase subunit I [Rhodonellum psychrophilum GCM71 = DSM 17998]|uniref:Cytochrome D oxidase subunit I n=3 Tax=Rhodonellum TaxID=336827 RepID=U5BIC9_9BACT|nr:MULTISPECIES: cytochrome d ubiquinol oxidase subunit II [Rhodonellum]ERM80170.1 cytochrome D oxidase subunit I [Rhodonellum psychrophilum GCM71 = DSM 17998]SDZ58597.1 cytochrome bd-I ubiquinol oxidase subunit 2 apoprotein [Rhodonellum ikkaensis]